MLTALQLATLEALADRMIPPDEDPGAVEAGAVDYLLRMLAGDLAAQLPAYAAGLDGLAAEAQARAGAPLAALSPADQDALLAQLAAGASSVPWGTDPAGFIAMAAEHLAEGYYSDPGGGGNRGGASWQMIGFEVRG